MEVRAYFDGFRVWFAKTSKHNNAVWVIVDKLTKFAHFVPFKIGTKMYVMADMFIKEIVRLHGIPASIVSDRILDFGVRSNRLWAHS